MLDPPDFSTKTRESSQVENAASQSTYELSRPVGAAIFSLRGEIATMGCNKVSATDSAPASVAHSTPSMNSVRGYSTFPASRGSSSAEK